MTFTGTSAVYMIEVEVASDDEVVFISVARIFAGVYVASERLGAVSEKTVTCHPIIAVSILTTTGTESGEVWLQAERSVYVIELLSTEENHSTHTPCAVTIVPVYDTSESWSLPIFPLVSTSISVAFVSCDCTHWYISLSLRDPLVVFITREYWNIFVEREALARCETAVVLFVPRVHPVNVFAHFPVYDITSPSI